MATATEYQRRWRAKKRQAETALILTDPPWENQPGDDPDVYFRWLAEWAGRVLVPGGSLLCYTGHAAHYRRAFILAQYLNAYWPCVMTHTKQHRMPGTFIRSGSTPVIWCVKGELRRKFAPNPDLTSMSMVQDTIKGEYDKELLEWSQGSAARIWVEALTERGDLVVDPFCGTAEWGHGAGAIGRRFIGCDRVAGGSTE
jgi:hypothetical protein